jgi:transposase
MSTLDHTLEPEVGAVRRLEVITGVGGRRRWSDEMKARIVHEAMRPGAVVSQIARRHGLAPQQVFTWRRLARRRAVAADHGPAFAPIVIEDDALAASASALPDRTGAAAAAAAAIAIIEIAVADLVIRVPSGTDPATLAMVLQAVRAPATP